MSGVGHKSGARYKCLVDLGDSPEDCWRWIGKVNKPAGYGHKQWHGETWLAHRWVWTMLFGKIPDGMVIDHLCRNRWCVNPHHLEIVSQTENSRRGNSTKITIEMAREIKADGKDRKWGDGPSIAKKYGVNTGLVHDIWHGYSWRDA